MDSMNTAQVLPMLSGVAAFVALLVLDRQSRAAAVLLWLTLFFIAAACVLWVMAL
jgi:hypothetical protein